MTVNTPTDPDNSPWFPHPAAENGARYAGVHYKTLLGALQRGECRGYQAGPRGRWRVHRDDVDRWLRGERPKRALRRTS
ncbi:DNA-binding protein [Kibdelosporangium aridum]|uniref:DNA-binding protein n=1 Tax=Kibdelosporangium aridum TaxID=2030 RepID=A0A428YV18_KIBAR|nr:DNA-binding protein [Kibdelosporangium aridum]